MKKAIITGVAGQDGFYLAKELLENGREVHGVDLSYDHTEGLPDEVERITGNISEIQFVRDLVKDIEPDEIYNMAAHTFVGSSWEDVYTVMRVNTFGVMHFLEAIKDLYPACRLYQASTSEMYGNSTDCPQNEDTNLDPVSPYGVSKVAAHNMCKVYRESFGIWVSCGIAFNHGSPRRPEIFVTRKISSGVAKIKKAISEDQPVIPIVLGNMKAERDWSHAADVTRAMRTIMESRDADDYVIASGVCFSVEDFCEASFSVAEIPISWLGEGVDQVGVLEDGTVAVRSSKEFYRPNELHQLCGDPKKLVRTLGWSPQYTFDDLVEEMVLCDLKRAGL